MRVRAPNEPHGGVDVEGTLDLTQSIRSFAGMHGDYYAAQFTKMQSRSKLTWSFNWAAALLGPIWAGGRGLWGLFCCLAMIELLLLVPICQGLWSDLGSEHRTKMERLEKNQNRMLDKVQKALDQGKEDKAASLRKNVDNLGKAVEKARLAIVAAEKTAATLVLSGLIALLVLKIIEGWWANYAYDKQYSRWRVDRSVRSGFSWMGAIAASMLLGVVYGVTVYRFTALTPPDYLIDFPVKRPDIHDPFALWIDEKFDVLSLMFSAFFQAISRGIRVILDGLETVFVDTPWPVVMTVIVATAWRLAGVRVAIFTVAAIAYIAVLGYWERSMSTIALLGTAAFLCIGIGIPLGVWFSRSDRALAFGRPVLDFMQTMPAFVYLIPVIAFFGTGKTPGIVASIVFGLPPIVRLTNLGLRQVPGDVKEAALSFGATKWQILKGVEVPLAMPSVLAGINQTILFCLSAVVIASLIGAKGLGHDILVALQYAAKGQGVLAGLAILFCAMVIDRIIQGKYRR